MSYFRNPIPKTQRPGKARYTIHNCHSKQVIANRNWNSNDYMRFVSIDPGRANLALRIEKRFNKSGSPIITEVLDKYNIIEYDTDEEGASYLYQMTNLIFDKYKNLIVNSHVILVEKQMPFNYKALRISQHIISYFICKLFNHPLGSLIIEIDAKVKTDMLEAPNKSSDRDVKRWAVIKAKELLNARNDKKGLDILDTTKGKIDDVCDTIVQIEAACVLFGWRLSPEPKNLSPIVDAPPLKILGNHAQDIVSSTSKDEGEFTIVTTKIRKKSVKQTTSLVLQPYNLDIKPNTRIILSIAPLAPTKPVDTQISLVINK